MKLESGFFFQLQNLNTTFYPRDEKQARSVPEITLVSVKSAGVLLKGQDRVVVVFCKLITFFIIDLS